MKIKNTDLLTLKRAIHRVLDNNPHIRADYNAKGLTPKRLRWDLLRLTGLRIGDGAGMRGDIELYAYLNDDHIDTALRYCMNCYD